MVKAEEVKDVSMDLIKTPYELCGHKVPGIWRFLLPPEVHKFRLPEERRSTCQNCPMVSFDDHDPLFRCCAYHPLTPGFLLGFALKDSSSRPDVEKLHEQGCLLPEGYQRSPVQWIEYLADLKEDATGDAAKVKCPLLKKDSGLCSIYPYRNAVCSTFFCLTDHGDVGDTFWTALEEVVSTEEADLQQWALMQAGFDVKAYYEKLDQLTPEIGNVTDNRTKGWKKEILKTLWEPFDGRELELLELCADAIYENRDQLWDIAHNVESYEAPNFERAMIKMVPKNLQDEIDPDDLVEGGDEVPLSELWKDCKKAYRALWKVPERLVLNQKLLIQPNPKNDKESKAFAHKPYRIALLKRKGGKSEEWKEFISEKSANALNSFREEMPINENGSMPETVKAIEEPMKFLAEWHSKKALLNPKKTRSKTTD